MVRNLHPTRPVVPHAFRWLLSQNPTPSPGSILCLLMLSNSGSENFLTAQIGELAPPLSYCYITSFYTRGNKQFPCLVPGLPKAGPGLLGTDGALASCGQSCHPSPLSPGPACGRGASDPDVSATSISAGPGGASHLRHAWLESSRRPLFLVDGNHVTKQSRPQSAGRVAGPLLGSRLLK